MYKKYVKRFFDIFISLIMLVICSPLLLITAVLVYLDLGLPLYNSIRERIGQNNKVFIMYKFRTKKLGKEYAKDGSQYTKLSRIIDSLRINELPQFINVIKGDMSIIGPRPYIPGEGFDGEEYYKRHSVKPGITGLAQIHNGRLISFKQKEYYDNYYADNISFLLDLKILFLTPVAVIKQAFIHLKYIIKG